MQHGDLPTRYAAALADRFVSLADTMVEDFDVVDLMDQLVATSVELLAIDAAGLMLRDARGDLKVVASSSEESRLLELFQLQAREGPCYEAVSSGRPVAVESIFAAAARWPRFVPQAEALGFTSLYSVPLRLRDQVVGGLNLFRTETPALSPDEQRMANALAAMATIGLLQQRAVSRATQLADQLQRALDSRVVIEQAKGVLAEYGGVDMDAAFSSMRGFARSSNERLSEVADSVVRRSIPLDAIVPAARQGPDPR